MTFSVQYEGLGHENGTSLMNVCLNLFDREMGCNLCFARSVVVNCDAETITVLCGSCGKRRQWHDDTMSQEHFESRGALLRDLYIS